MAEDTTTTTTDDTSTDDTTDDDVKGPADQLDWQAAARKHEREAKKLRTEIESLRKANQTEAEAALEAARKEAADSVRNELGSELTTTKLELAVIKSVGAKFADPADAALFLDVAAVTTDDGAIDQDALTKSVDKLLETKPYLAAAAGTTKTKVPQGPRGAAADDGDMNSLIRRAAGVE